MRIGIFGFAGAGKTTVFNILTGLNADTGYGGSKINLGVTRVPEERVDFLAEIYQPKKKIYGEITFADLPGSSPSKTGAGLDAQKVGDFKAMDVLTLVLSGFDNPMSKGGPDPTKD